MKDTLAETVLARVVDWDTAKLSEERLDLELLAELKYDEYRQFSTGMRFIESLSLWLGQFDAGAERNVAYDLIKQRLVFISNAEMRHYIKMAYADHVKPILVGEAARKADVSKDYVAQVVKSVEFSGLKKKCLYLGLSDGSRMDDFRRSSNLDHEQVYTQYEIASVRQEKMAENLAKSLGCEIENAKFEVVFLIDDFSASGLSYIREKGDKFDGKINAFLQQFADDIGCPKSILAKDTLIVILLYVATDSALSHIKKLVSQLIKKYSIRLEVVAVHEIREVTASPTLQEMEQLEPILKKYFDTAVVTTQYKTGRHEKGYLGFNECGLLVVLTHNCPNNTLPIIWHESEGAEIRALFPRHQRFIGE